MTDIHLLSDTELNEAIAVKRGWEYYPNANMTEYKWLMRNSKGMMIAGYYHVPDFTHDRGLAMELLEEMAGEHVFGGLSSTSNKWWVSYKSEHNTYKSILCDTPQRAICEAWLEWRGK